MSTERYRAYFIENEGLPHVICDNATYACAEEKVRQFLARIPNSKHDLWWTVIEQVTECSGGQNVGQTLPELRKRTS